MYFNVEQARYTRLKVHGLSIAYPTAISCRYMFIFAHVCTEMSYIEKSHCMGTHLSIISAIYVYILQPSRLFNSCTMQ